MNMGITELTTATKFDDYEIAIEANPDRWRGGLVWAVCFDDEELVSGLEFSHKLAKDVA
jgi:hypothetical protein